MAGFEERIRALSWWQGDIEVAPLEGGITNHNFVVSRVANPDEKFVVRLGDDIPVHQILRFNEIAASKAAFEAGLAPAVRHHENGILVLDYINGRTLTAEDIQQPDLLERLIPVIRQCHTGVKEHLRGASVVFWVFHVIRDYGASLIDGNSSHCDKLKELLANAQELESAAGPFDIVFGHNDLLAGNFMDDGQKIWLIDWEYAGFNSPLFDLGGLASNNSLSEEQEQWMLESYFDCSLTTSLWVRYQAMKTASLLRETMWSMISELHSTLDFDYAQYTQENLQRFESSMQRFKELNA